MSGLGVNKVMASVLMVGLTVLGLQTLSGAVFSDGGHGKPHGEAGHEGEAPPKFAFMPDMPEEVIEAETVVDAGPLDFGRIIPAADLGAGERIAKLCIACHTLEKGGADKTGPHMWDVMGRPAGAVAGFKYSDAMLAYAKPWSYQNMYDYLENPRGYVPGTAMSFAGVKKSQDRVNLIAYLHSLSDAPIPLPEPIPEVVPAVVDGEVFEGAPVEGAPVEGAPVEGAVPAAPAAPAERSAARQCAC